MQDTTTAHSGSGSSESPGCSLFASSPSCRRKRKDQIRSKWCFASLCSRTSCRFVTTSVASSCSWLFVFLYLCGGLDQLLFALCFLARCRQASGENWLNFSLALMQPVLVSPVGSDQAQLHHPASLSSESGESLPTFKLLLSSRLYHGVRSPCAGAV
jgi:hypothetical protein